MFSIYCSAFNVNEMSFDYSTALGVFNAFAEEVVIAVNTSRDGTLETLHKHKRINNLHKLKIVETSFDYNDLAFDGKIKNVALQECTKDFCIGLDLDEFIPWSALDNWKETAKFIGESEDFNSVLIPSIDLYYSYKHAKNVGFKWYLHKREGMQRGVVNFAKLDNGKIDIEKSDTCELLDKNGNLTRSLLACPINYSTEEKLNFIKKEGAPYVFHTGWLNKEQRLKQNKFWKPVWENRAGREVNNIIEKVEDFGEIKYFEHGLPLC